MNPFLYSQTSRYENLIRRTFLNAELKKFSYYNAYRRYCHTIEGINIGRPKQSESVQFTNIKKYLKKTIEQLLKKKISASNKLALKGLISDVDADINLSQIDIIIDRALEYSRELIEKK